MIDLEFKQRVSQTYVIHREFVIRDHSIEREVILFCYFEAFKEVQLVRATWSVNREYLNSSWRLQALSQWFPHSWISNPNPQFFASVSNWFSKYLISALLPKFKMLLKCYSFKTVVKEAEGILKVSPLTCGKLYPGGIEQWGYRTFGTIVCLWIMIILIAKVVKT